MVSSRSIRTTRPRSRRATRWSRWAVCVSRNRSARMRLPSTDATAGGDAAQPPLVGEATRWSRIGTAAVGALLGGSIGGLLVVAVTLVLKAGMDFGAGQRLWYVV